MFKCMLYLHERLYFKSFNALGVHPGLFPLKKNQFNDVVK